MPKGYFFVDIEVTDPGVVALVKRFPKLGIYNRRGWVRP